MPYLSKETIDRIPMDVLKQYGKMIKNALKGHEYRYGHRNDKEMSAGAEIGGRE